MVHDEYSQKAVRVFYTRVGHLYKNVCIFLEVHHELLLLLHVAESIFIYTVCVVEKQVVFTRQLDFDLLYLILARSKQKKNLNANGFKCANFLGSLTRVLNPQLKRCLAIEHDFVTLR